MKGLIFKFVDLLTEIDAVGDMAHKLLEADGPDILIALKKQLQQIQDSGSKSEMTWGISRNRPLNTRISEGEYEPGSGGGYHIKASITSAWSIRPIIESNKRSGRRPDKLEISGNASTSVKFIGKPPVDHVGFLPRWNVDIAKDDSPGCFFHIQFLSDPPPGTTHKSIPVPRFPAYPMTPMAALDFVLGELFQDEWATESSSLKGSALQWRSVQLARLQKYLKWQLKALDQNRSPFAVLKGLKPSDPEFLI